MALSNKSVFLALATSLEQCAAIKRSLIEKEGMAIAHAVETASMAEVDKDRDFYSI